MRTAEQRPENDQQRTGMSSVDLLQTNNKPKDTYAESDRRLENYGMNEDDHNWMVKAMALYRKELARRHGISVSMLSSAL